MCKIPRLSAEEIMIYKIQCQRCVINKKSLACTHHITEMSNQLGDFILDIFNLEYHKCFYLKTQFDSVHLHVQSFCEIIF